MKNVVTSVAIAVTTAITATAIIAEMPQSLHDSACEGPASMTVLFRLRNSSPKAARFKLQSGKNKKQVFINK